MPAGGDPSSSRSWSRSFCICGETPGVPTATLATAGCSSSPPEVNCTVSPARGTGIEVSFHDWPTFTSSPICTSPLLPPASMIANAFSYTSRSTFALPSSEGIRPGCEQSKRTQRDPGGRAAIFASRLAGSATDANSDFSSFATIPNAWVSFELISTVCNNATSRRTKPSTATRLASSAEILRHESIRPSSLLSIPQREPPVFSHLDWSTLPLWFESMSR